MGISGQDLVQRQAHAAVFSDEARHAQALGAADFRVQLAGLTDVQVGLKVRVAGQKELRLSKEDIRLMRQYNMLTVL